MAEDSEDDSERTEEPSQKKLDDAIERGDVVKSMEVSSFFLLGSCMIMIAFLATGMGRDLARPLAGMLEHMHEIPVDRRGLTGVYLEAGKVMATVLGLPVLMFIVAGVAGNMIQHRTVWTAEPLMPKLNRVSPAAGFKRLFSADSLAVFVKGLIKIVVVSAGIWFAVRPELFRLEDIVATDILGLLAITQRLAIRLMAAVLVVMAFVAVLDYLFQRQRWIKRLRMTRQELKEEYKQQEGNPEIKAKIRQLRQQRSQKRMMAQVPKATVVVTNPTHYAVALRYEPGMSAPVCVAKGVDAIALRIRETAEKAEVPVVENPPLARALHATVDLDGEVPEEHYRAVAEVIGFVMRMRERARGWRPD
ncbi:flagellar biosynthesis protein FlhB [Prosthecomicrobium sp. N25]|uniref:flagellar biosynthesis protein FlhB n=1 Tax=Prosthecomicrobium sp. N25 TaxID=3129254 RepID=UPI0030774A79